MPKPTCRTMWMFPRNIRRIEPWKLVQIATLLNSASDQTIESQSVQNNMYAELERLGVKGKANPNGVANSGGFRTYLAQLACLGFFWRNPEDGRYETTYAGELLLNAEHPSELLRCQLLRMQYPSVYGLGHNVAISPALSVKPFVFLVRLLQDERLGLMLTSDEMAIAVIYGHTPRDYEKVVQKILKFRDTNDFRSIVDSVDDLRTPKRYHPDDPEEDWNKGIEDAKNIGNTAKNYMMAAGLLAASDRNTRDFMLNDDQSIQQEIARWMREADSIEKLDPDHAAAWQQRYGRYDKTKAIRKPGTEKTSRICGFTSLIRSRFVSALSENPFGTSVTDFVKSEAVMWSRSPADISKIIAPLKTKVFSMERDMVRRAAASGGKEAIQLECAVTSILTRLGFDQAEHVGQKRAERMGGYPDVRILYNGAESCGFGDTKATMNYEFGLGDRVKLETYYHDCWKEFPGKTPSSYFLYIAGGFGRRRGESVEKKLQEATAQYGHPVSAITAEALVDLVEMASPPTPYQIQKAFEKGKYFASSEELCLEVQKLGKVA